MTESKHSPPRSAPEIRDLVVGVASRQFAANGFAVTTTRSIASEAGVSTSVLHRHFPTKERLFSAALLAPFLAFFEEFSAAWSSQLDEPWDDEKLLGEYVRDLYDNLVVHRKTLVTLLAVGEDNGAELIAELRAGLAGGLADLRIIGEREATSRGWLAPEVVRYTNALVIALVTGLVLIAPIMADQDYDDDAFVDAATRLALHGIALGPRGDQRPSL